MLIRVSYLTIKNNEPDKEDYYQILGLDREATEQDIKQAFKMLVKKYHPDINKDPDAIIKFKAINKAYKTLSDNALRVKYDLHLNALQPIYLDANIDNIGGWSGFEIEK
jgi:molecular chaperone DnaJ